MRGWFVDEANKATSLPEAIVGIFVNNNILKGVQFNSQFIFTIATILLAIIIFKVINNLKNEDLKTKNLLIFMLAWALFPPILASLLGNPLPKYFCFSLPAWTFLTGYLTHKATTQYGKLIILTIFTLLLSNNLEITGLKIANWNLLFGKLENTPNTKIFVSFLDALILRRYYSGPIPFEEIYTNNDNFSLEERVARYNWQQIVCDENCINEWATRELKDYDHIYILKRNKMIEKWLAENNWYFTKSLSSKSDIDDTIYEYHKK